MERRADSTTPSPSRAIVERITNRTVYVRSSNVDVALRVIHAGFAVGKTTRKMLQIDDR
jgi:hypothetical protein